jgi:predicted glycoside hydrolase/deacetylase ChbG (UPF0249 family)
MKAIEFTKQGKAIITTDDFCVSNGVDNTTVELIKMGALNTVSSFVTTERFNTSIIKLHNLKTNIGLHLDFTFGNALSIKGKSLITDETGSFNQTFAQILFLSIFKPQKMKELIQCEAKAQILKLIEFIPQPTHIDGHQHIHTIPLVSKIIQKLAKEHNIPRIRIINESIFQWQVLNIFNIKNTIKLLLLRTLEVFNKHQSSIYFISIFHTCKIKADYIKNYNIPKGFDNIEIMLHVGNTELDGENTSKEKSHLQSKWRDVECKMAKELASINKNSVSLKDVIFYK